MTLFAIKKYQSDAIDSLTEKVSKLLNGGIPNSVCVFQSPTGSGKTFMAAKFIEELILNETENEICFLWVSIGKGELQKQSKDALVRMLGERFRINLFEDEFTGSRTIIEKNEIVVINWEKLYNKYQSGENKGEWKNKAMRDGETTNFIEIMTNTKENRKIILIIDESHYASDAERTNELREIINANVTIEMSATPKIQPTAQDIAKGLAEYIYIDPKEVIEAGMIKKDLIINPNITDLIDDEKTSQDLILEAAFNKRLEILDAFNKNGIEINPLCLIQLPNSEAGESKRDAIINFLANKGITEENGKVAIWLSNEKSEHLDKISQSISPIEYLIFKQAIDTGWDCPRAHILVKLRDIQSYTFEVQTVGRILRMPEQKHYSDEILNSAYIFTNLQSIVVNKEDYNPNIIKHLKATRKNHYKPINIKSFYKSRVDFGDITVSFYAVLESVFCDYFKIDINDTLINPINNLLKLSNLGLQTDISSYKESMISDGIISGVNFDLKSDNLMSLNNDIDIKLSNNDLLDLFNVVIKANLNGFSPKRSIPVVRSCIYQLFKKYLGINYQYNNGAIDIQYIFLNKVNISHFSLILSKATGKYKPIKQNEIKNKIEENFYNWDIKKEEFYNQYTDEIVQYKNYLYEPCYLSINRSEPEKKFEKFIDSLTDKIDWWYKNGESKKDFLGIRYEENNLPSTFYPDFIVKFKSGKILIADTKAGITASEAKLKAESLFHYIKEESSNNSLFGGILILDRSNKWRINQNEFYDYNPNDLTKWHFLDEII